MDSNMAGIERKQACIAQNGLTDKCGKNGKGFQVKELWRREIRSFRPVRVCEGGKWRCDKIWGRSRLLSCCCD